MTMKDNKHSDQSTSLSDPSVSALMGRQSVRATFKLTPRSISVLSTVSIHLGIKQKSLFDHLMEDHQALNAIAKKFELRRFNAMQRIQKTFVLSRKTLTSLCNAAEDSGMPRDALVEYSIYRLESVLSDELKKQKTRKQIQNRLAEQINNIKKILQDSQKMLGKDDTLCRSLETMTNNCISVYNDLELFIDKGKIIEEFEYSS